MAQWQATVPISVFTDAMVFIRGTVHEYTRTESSTALSTSD